jgi:hypothetical protein
MEIVIAPTTMVFKSAKKALRYAKKHNCTVDMLYLDDLKKTVVSMTDIGDYDGPISSCIDITSKLCDKYSPFKVASILHKKYKMDMTHVHRCISIHLGALGVMDDEYIKMYPDSNLSGLGTTLIDYNSAVKDTVALASLVTKAKKLPQYNLDSFSVVYSCSEGYVLDLNKIFSEMGLVDVALQYDTSCSVFVSYNGNTENVRRKVSTFVMKDIPKKYVEFVPKPMDRDGVVMARWNTKDFRIYHDRLVFECDGNDLDNITTYADNAMSIFGIESDKISFAYQTNTKASLMIHVDDWNAVILEDLIINDNMFSRVMSVANGVLEEGVTEEILHRNRSLVVYISHASVRCVFRHVAGALKVSIASSSIDDTAVIIAVALVQRLVKEYNNNFASAYERYSLHVRKISSTPATTKPQSKIDSLRRRLPELFANNYTRECHNLPVMLDTEKEAEAYRKMGRLVIKYPLDGEYSRWYTSPSDDLYVGLKLNRLSNKAQFKHIVTCYTSNHYENPNRETYIYYRGDDRAKKGAVADLITLRILSPGRRGPLPIAMTVEHDLQGYMRLGTGGSFLDCITHALGVDKNKFLKLVHKGMGKGLLNVLRQELWNLDDDEILDGIADISRIDGTKYYRLFEEVYQHNILIVEIGHRGKYAISIPECRGRYIWQPCNGKYIVVAKNGKKLYDEHLVSYELVVYGDQVTFDEEDPLVLAMVSSKTARTVRSDVDESIVKRQYITEHGKCNVVATKDGMMKCNSRPLYKPVMDVGLVRRESTLYNYLKTIPMTSTSKCLYFPDNVSFLDWWTR